MTDRVHITLNGITKEMKGLEIGPSYNPIAPKSDNWNIRTIDHTDQASLVEKYEKHGVDVTAIEPVDYICNGGNYLEIIPVEEQATFDYVISSHMIEHTPDLLSFLHQVEVLLKRGGILTLIIPNKYGCFDFFRPLTTTADILYGQPAGSERHQRKTAFENMAYECNCNGKVIWDQSEPDKSFSLNQDIRHIHHVCENIWPKRDTYIDHHNWKFSPSSFRLIMYELKLLGKTAFVEHAFNAGQHGEFYVQLKKDPEQLPATSMEQVNEIRMGYLRQMQNELLAANRELSAPTPDSNKPTERFGLIKSLTPPVLHPLLARVYHTFRQ